MAKAKVEGVQTETVKTPEVDEGTNPSVETEEPVVKSGFKKVKAAEFRGSYKDAQFDDDGVCQRITEKTLNELQTDFPGIELEELN